MKRSSRWRTRLGRLLLLILALVALAGVVALVIRFAPPWLVSTKGLTGAARLNELSRVRVALVVLILGALAGAVAIYLLRSSARERRDENQERLLIERFMRAVDQLGHPALDVRLGGIYSLERLAHESPEHHPPIIEILAAFVREHAPWPARGSGRAGNGARPGAAAAGHGGETRSRPPTDVQAALTVLGRRRLEQDTDAPLFLSYTALAGATLTGAHLERAMLSGTNLEGADLFKAHLNTADLEGASLRGAGLLLANLNDTVLWGANLEGARLYGANLEGAALKGANLKDGGLTGANLKDAGLHGAVLSGADLTGANLEGTGLEGANLEGANLQGANLRGAVLLNAIYDESTIWPGGFDVAAQGAVRRAWPQEPAPWVREPSEQPARRGVVGWPHEEQEVRQAPVEWPRPPAPAWPHASEEAPPSHEATAPAAEDAPTPEPSAEPAPDADPEPPAEPPAGSDLQSGPEVPPAQETETPPPPPWGFGGGGEPGPPDQ
ncbi:MAG: pentapeptide repeat-containing protein [Solirubrobacterales bacterium]|nr:pentapeptide repeat-containing protein [Solirubrobacterales bacterium]